MQEDDETYGNCAFMKTISASNPSTSCSIPGSSNISTAPTHHGAPALGLPDSEKEPSTASRSRQGTESPGDTIRVLIAEDNEADAYLVREALSGMNVDVILRKDGEQMIQTIEEIDAGTLRCPDIVLLDLNLPRYSGIEVLERLRASAACGSVPVIIVTSSDAPRDRHLAAIRSVSGYFRKPSDFAEFMRLGELIREVIAK